MQGDDEYAGSEELVDAFFADSLTEMERRHALERAGRISAEIQIDLETGGPLALYAKGRREDATAAMQELAIVDPKDAVGIAMLQATVREYLRVCEWVSARGEEAAEAERIIKREYPDEQGPDPDDE